MNTQLNKSVMVLLKPSSLDFITRLQEQSDEAPTLSRIVNEALYYYEAELRGLEEPSPKN